MNCSCSTDWYCSDSVSVSAAPECLTDMVGHMTKDTGLVLQMPFCCDRKGFASIYEKVMSKVKKSPKLDYCIARYFHKAKLSHFF